MSNFVSSFGGASGIGAQGAQGSPGPQATPGVNIYNAGATLGAFASINFVGGLNGVTGANNIVQVNSIPDFVQVGITGAGASSSVQLASGAMVQWNTQKGSALGALGHTNIGTAAGWITASKSAYYQVNAKINFTGLPSGVVVQTQQLLGATGALSSGTPVSQSVAYLQSFSYTGVAAFSQTVDTNYVVYIPSGSSITTHINYITGGGGSPVFLSPTGTFFDIRSIGA